MAGQNLLDFLNSLDGQCQAERFPAALDPAAAPIDDRSTQQMLQDLRQNLDTKLAGLLPQTAVETPDGTLPPHHGLLLAILQLLKHPQRLLNTFTDRHLAFQFQQILGFRTRPPIPNRTWVSLSLKKNAAPVVLGRSDCLVAGEGPDGQPQLFAPVRPLYVGQAKLTDLCRQRMIDGAVIADQSRSQDAWGESSSNGWEAFGNTPLPRALFGFAVASPLLRLAEGQRTMTIRLAVGNLPLSSGLPTFVVEYTSEQGWTLPDAIKLATTFDDDATIEFTITVNSDNMPVTDFDRKLHDGRFATTWPMVRFLCPAANASAMQTLSSLVVRRVEVSVKADGIRNLQIRNKAGLQDSSRSFPLFGPVPEIGDAVRIDYAEALTKPISEQILTFMPATSSGLMCSGRAKKTQVRCNTEGGKLTGPEESRFSASREAPERIFTHEMIDPKAIDFPMLLRAVTARLLQSFTPSGPSSHSELPFAETDPLIKIWLNRTAGKTSAKDYPVKLAEWLAKGASSEGPEHPDLYEVNSLTLSYTTEVQKDQLSDTSNLCFSIQPVQFFQIDSFGVRREHAAIRQLSPAEPETTVRLLPDLTLHGDALFFGFQDLKPGESLSLLIDVLSASAPTEESVGIRWFVLCGNHWKYLTSDEILVDTTLSLRQSGLLQVAIPTTASTEHTIMPAGKIWLKACSASPNFRCSLAGIYCHAMEVDFVSGDRDLAAAPLPPDSITRLQNPIAGIRSVQQPLPGFGGRAAESPREMYRRAAERLRHRNRAVNLWDYERLVLNEFPDIERVKCIPHSDGQNWNRPGHVAVVLVPDVSLRTRAAETLRPAIPQSRLTEVETFLNSVCPLGVKTHALSPCYQEIRADFQVKFQPGLPFTYYRSLLEQSLTGYLAPWTMSASANIRFGHTIYRSAVLNHIEDLDYVDFVTDFNCFLTDAPEVTQDEWLLQATRPDGVLTSAASHDIREYRGT